MPFVCACSINTVPGVGVSLVSQFLLILHVQDDTAVPDDLRGVERQRHGHGVSRRIATFISKARETLELHPFAIVMLVPFNARDCHLEHLVPVYQQQERVWHDKLVALPCQYGDRNDVAGHWSAYERVEEGCWGCHLVSRLPGRIQASAF
jgi:hypothetical protein